MEHREIAAFDLTKVYETTMAPRSKAMISLRCIHALHDAAARFKLAGAVLACVSFG